MAQVSVRFGDLKCTKTSQEHSLVTLAFLKKWGCPPKGHDQDVYALWESEVHGNKPGTWSFESLFSRNGSIFERERDMFCEGMIFWRQEHMYICFAFEAEENMTAVS